MAKFFTLSSSSKGNCCYVAGNNCGVLVDVGISYRQVALQLESRSRSMKDIQGVLITHEHTDHIRGLKALLGKHSIPVYATIETLEYLAEKDMVPPKADLIAIDGDFTVGDLQVRSFDTPHDARHSVGYRITLPDENVVAIATDLGHVTAGVFEQLKGANLVLLESNFDMGMLNNGSYPYALKRRIQGEMGHLENGDCAEVVARLVQGGGTHFILGHLSEENNLPLLAFETTKSILAQQGIKLNQDYRLSVAPAKAAHEMVIF